MRIVSGLYGGRKLIAPKTDATRPMTDKVRAALFDILGDISGAVFADVYAGSGAIGLEALSRGAQMAVIVEPSRRAVQAIESNIQSLNLGTEYQLQKSTAESWLARDTNVGPFDIIVADPPYDILKADILEKLGQLLKPSGLLVVSHRSKLSIPALEGLEIAQEKIYGDSALSVYRATRA